MAGTLRPPKAAWPISAAALRDPDRAAILSGKKLHPSPSKHRRHAVRADLSCFRRSRPLARSGAAGLAPGVCLAALADRPGVARASRGAGCPREGRGVRGRGRVRGCEASRSFLSSGPGQWPHVIAFPWRFVPANTPTRPQPRAIGPGRGRYVSTGKLLALSARNADRGLRCFCQALSLTPPLLLLFSCESSARLVRAFFCLGWGPPHARRAPAPGVQRLPLRAGVSPRPERVRRHLRAPGGCLARAGAPVGGSRDARAG